MKPFKPGELIEISGRLIIYTVSGRDFNTIPGELALVLFANCDRDNIHSYLIMFREYICDFNVWNSTEKYSRVIGVLDD